MLRKDRFQQAWKPIVQIIPAQRIHVGGADGLGLNQARVSQHPEVMGHGRLWTAAVQLATAGLAKLCETPNDFQAHRIAQGVQQTLKNEFAERGMFEGAHE